ncbi:unnamed protein product [Dibothriocephalus latus]|uniref:RH1 domain-containing protein n=1 Tax=Dibothriocephalus latus TaxID=60516 RepID=A0A3P7P292_DIBLA|nr:unnamed protein product [Dibothriocephalus latus]
MNDHPTTEETGFHLDASHLNDSFAEFLSPDPATDGDSSGLSTHVQTIARRVYQEFEAVLEAHGPAVLEPLMPIMVSVLEKLDELFKDQFAYRAEVSQLREDKASLVAELEREKTNRKDAEDRLLSAEDQFEDERKTLNEALAQNETLIKQLELKSQNALDQLARMEKREADSSNENSKLHGRIDELLRSNLELADNLKNAVSTPVRPTQPKSPANAFDATSGGVGFDELSVTDGADISPCDDELTVLQSSLTISIRTTGDGSQKPSSAKSAIAVLLSGCYAGRFAPVNVGYNYYPRYDEQFRHAKSKFHLHRLVRLLYTVN